MTLHPLPNHGKPACSLPLLQIWPSQDSPRSEPDGQSFIFSVLSDDTVSQPSIIARQSTSSTPFSPDYRRNTSTRPSPSRRHRTLRRRRVVEARSSSSTAATQALTRFRPRLHRLHNNQISQLSLLVVMYSSILPAVVPRHPTSNSSSESSCIPITLDIFGRQHRRTM